MEVGQLISINGLILEICKVEDYQCSNCVAFKKKTLCRNLPDCGNTLYYKKLNYFDIRKAKKEKKQIEKI